MTDKPFHIQIYGRPFCVRMEEPIYRERAWAAGVRCCAYKSFAEAADKAAALAGAGQNGVAVAFGPCTAVADRGDS